MWWIDLKISANSLTWFDHYYAHVCHILSMLSVILMLQCIISSGKSYLEGQNASSHFMILKSQHPLALLVLLLSISSN